MKKIILGIMLLLVTLIIIIINVPPNKEDTIITSTLDEPKVITIIVSENSVLEGWEAKQYVVESLRIMPQYLEIFNEKYDQFIGKKHNGKYARLIISPKVECMRGVCVGGRFETRGNILYVILYKNVIDNQNEMIFYFLHELGHLIENYYLNVLEMIEWNDMFQASWEKHREDSIDEFLREYSKKSWDEDFSDAYAEYVLSEIGVHIYDNTITDNRTEFLKRLLKRIEPKEEVIVIRISE